LLTLCDLGHISQVSKFVVSEQVRWTIGVCVVAEQNDTGDSPRRQPAR
jgi:hypothetical protein